MSDLKHRLFIGADTSVDIDGAIIEQLSPSFTFDSTAITFDSLTRRFDENI